LKPLAVRRPGDRPLAYRAGVRRSRPVREHRGHVRRADRPAHRRLHSRPLRL